LQEIKKRLLSNLQKYNKLHKISRPEALLAKKKLKEKEIFLRF